MSKTRTRSTTTTQVNLALRALVFGMCLLLNSCATSPAVRSRTFFVIPLTLPDGTPGDSQREVLERWLIERAGGFTDLGPVRGAWMDHEGQVIEEQNRAYLVSVAEHPEEFEHELRRRIITDFQQEEAYVERW